MESFETVADRSARFRGRGFDRKELLLHPPTLLTGTELTGAVKSTAGKPLEGVAVSARADNASYTTTVYTDQKGEYFFPPLESGNYKVWAQAVGFEYIKSELAISSGKKVQHQFMLNPLQDFPPMQLFHRRLVTKHTGNAAWGRQDEDDNNSHLCITCHTAGFALQNKFDTAGWTKILNMMELQGIEGDSCLLTTLLLAPPLRPIRGMSLFCKALDKLNSIKKN